LRERIDAFFATAFGDADARLQQRYKEIQQIVNFVEQHGSQLVLVLIPAKARIYQEKVAQHRPAEFRQSLYTQALGQFALMDIDAPDLRPALRSGATDPTFLKTDTHWTPAGAKQSADSIATYIQQKQLLSLQQAADFKTELVEKKDYRGDLLNFIPLGPFDRWLGPELDTVNVYQTVNSMTLTDDNLFSEVDINVVLVGSSYSANALWNFDGALKQALGQDLVNYAEEGLGPLIPMLNYLSSSDFQEQPPELIIWEFPERYLPVEYDITQYVNVFQSGDRPKVAESL